MEYWSLVEVYDRLDATTSTLEKADILAETLADAGDLLPELSLLLRGRLFAPWEADDPGVSSSLTADAIAVATGVDRERIESWWRDTGDLGDAAALAVENRRQATLFSESHDVRTVYGTLCGLAVREGAGSQGRRIDDIADLLADAEPDEARYIVRTIVGAMRLGVGEGTVRDAIARAFLDDSEGAVAAVERAYEVTNDGNSGVADVPLQLRAPVPSLRRLQGRSRPRGSGHVRASETTLRRTMRVDSTHAAGGSGNYYSSSRTREERR